jgi:energy-coupling factor transport system permease protein
MNNQIDARAWLLWVAAAAILVMVARNPLYTILIMAAVHIVRTSRAPGAGLPLPIWRLGLFLVVISALLNALSVHVGETVLFHLPAAWPLVGGPITLEGFVYGAVNGLVLLGLLAVFAALNALVPPHELVQLTPGALHDLGVVVLIAITYVPETLRHWRRIRGAQAIRGHRLRGIRDWRPVVIPLLVGGLERAMGLAEVMVARGYGAAAGQEQNLRRSAILLLALLLTFVGWLLIFWLGWPGWLLLAGGLVLLIGSLWRLGRQRPRTRYRPARWGWPETWVLVAALLPLLATLLPLPWIDRTTLFYSPYPRLILPPFDPLLGIGLALLALPAVWTAPDLENSS